MPERGPRHPRVSHPREQARRGWRGRRPAMTVTESFNLTRSDQILLGDDLSEPRIVEDELLDELVHAVLEDVVHVGVLEPVADAAGVALGRTLAAIGHANLVEIADKIAVA